MIKLNDEKNELQQSMTFHYFTGDDYIHACDLSTGIKSVGIAVGVKPDTLGEHHGWITFSTEKTNPVRKLFFDGVPFTLTILPKKPGYGLWLRGVKHNKNLKPIEGYYFTVKSCSTEFYSQHDLDTYKVR